MQFTLATSNYCENWTYDNPDTKGIGGSETAQIELAWRLARRGHDVVSYGPMPFDGWQTWRGTRWSHYDNIDYSRSGAWLVYRSPELLDNFYIKHSKQIIYYIAQDTAYLTATAERYSKIDYYVCLCQDHKLAVAKEWPELADRIVVWRNGIKSEEIKQVLEEGIERDPYKMIYCSSPDRGLENLLEIYARAKEYEPRLNLHVFYGFDNFDTVINGTDHRKAFVAQLVKDRILKAVAAHPDVRWHGRIPQPRLHRELASAGLWVYPTRFTETFAINHPMAQALGAIPITNPIWGLKDYAVGGIRIEGNPDNDLLVRRRYVGEILRLTSDIGLQESIRRAMMPEAIEKFSWERVADLAENAAYQWEPSKEVAHAGSR